MPAPRDLAAELARNTADLFADAEARLAAALARQVRADIQADYADRLAGLAKVRQAAQQVLARLDSRSHDAAQRAVLQGFAAGAQAGVDELVRLGGDRGRDWLARRSKVVAAIARLLGITKRRDMRLQDELAGLRSALPGIDAIMALIQELTQRLSSTHLRVLRWEQDAYRAVMAAPALDVLAGLKTRLRASQVVMDDLAAQGIKGFTDKSGRDWTLGAYAEMATRTTVAHATIEGHISQLRANGVELVMVSNSPEECEICRPWEGAILAIVGGAGPRVVEHGLIDDRMVTVDVKATVGEAIAQGLFHPNCTHRLVMYLPGVTRVPTNTENPQGYADRQELRRLERETRKAKRRAAAALTPEARQAWEKRVRARQAQIGRHVDKTGQFRRRDREQLEHDDVNPPTPRVPLPPRKRPSRARAPEPTPEATEPVQPPMPEPPPRPTASNATRAKIDEALAGLPADREGWDAPVTEVGPTLAERRLAEERANLAQAREAHKRLVAEIQDEFRRKRTPHARRRQILEERTEETRREIQTYELYVESLERYAALTPETATDAEQSWLRRESTIVYPTDPNGRKLPPAQYERWLDHVLEVGESLMEDIQQALETDEEYQRHHAGLDTPSGMDEAAIKGAARRKFEVIRDVLESVRPLGGHEQTLGENDGTARKNWRDLLREVEPVFPTDWLHLADDRGPLDATGAERAYFRRKGYGNPNDIMAFGYTESHYHGLSAFSSNLAETTAHELGHRMEQAVPGLTHLEYTMVRKRATQDGTLKPPSKLHDLLGGGYTDSEITYEDEWAHPYMGKTYAETVDHPAAEPGELFTVAVQSLYGQSSGTQAGPPGHAFALGVLALLGRR